MGRGVQSLNVCRVALPLYEEFYNIVGQSLFSLNLLVNDDVLELRNRRIFCLVRMIFISFLRLAQLATRNFLGLQNDFSNLISFV